MVPSCAQPSIVSSRCIAEDVRDARHVCNSLERAIAKEFGIDEKRMQMRNSAVKSLNCMMKMCAEGRKRCSGDGMRPLYSVQEEAIAQRILHLRELHHALHAPSNASGLALAAYPVLKSFHVHLTQSIDTDGKESDDSEWSIVMRTLQRMQMKMKK